MDNAINSGKLSEPNYGHPYCNGKGRPGGRSPRDVRCYPGLVLQQGAGASEESLQVLDPIFVHRGWLGYSRLLGEIYRRINEEAVRPFFEENAKFVTALIAAGMQNVVPSAWSARLGIYRSVSLTLVH